MKQRKQAKDYPMSELAEGHYVGIVDDIGFTMGGMGNQWTVIDGKRYVTFWDARRKDWRVGDNVRFTVAHRSFGYWNNGEPPSAPHAESIHRVERDQKDPARWALAPRSSATA